VPELDTKLTKKRILQEARNMSRVRKSGVYTPHLILIDEINRKIYMEFIENSITVKELIWTLQDYSHPGENTNNDSNRRTNKAISKYYSKNA